MAIEATNRGKNDCDFSRRQAKPWKKTTQSWFWRGCPCEEKRSADCAHWFPCPSQRYMILKGRIQKRKTFGCWQVKGCCYISVGEPWTVTKCNEEKITSPKLRQVTKKMMCKIAEQVQRAKSETESYQRNRGLISKFHKLFSDMISLLLMLNLVNNDYSGD